MSKRKVEKNCGACIFWKELEGVGIHRNGVCSCPLPVYTERYESLVNIYNGTNCRCWMDGRITKFEKAYNSKRWFNVGVGIEVKYFTGGSITIDYLESTVKINYYNFDTECCLDYAALSKKVARERAKEFLFKLIRSGVMDGILDEFQNE